MTTAEEPLSLERVTVALVATALVSTFVAAAIGASGVELAPTALAALLLCVVSTPWVARRLPSDWDGQSRRHPVLCLLWFLLGVAAVARLAGVSLFMIDASQAQASAFWFDPFYIRHSCFSAYWRAAELARDGVANLYDPTFYSGSQGRFKLDVFLYLPQFLILPAVGMAMGAGFFELRSVWFAIEGGLVLLAMGISCRWIGGALGRRALLLMPAVLITTPVVLTLQVGNFQIAAIALSMLAMLAFARNRPALGGSMLGFAVFKIFPGILGVYLLATRQWRAAAWTFVFSLLYTAIAYTIFGSAPFDAFLHFQMPRILNGDAWAFLRIEGLEAVVAINDSVPGLVNKLRTLGVPGMTPVVQHALGWVWTLAVVALAWLSATRSTTMSRLELVAAWLALLALASFRSPFLPDHNGLLAPIWLWAFIAAGALGTWRNIVLLTVAWLGLTAVLPFTGGPLAEGVGRFAVSAASQVLAIGLCLWVLLRRPRGSPAAASPHRPASSAVE